ncbi:hypothetical protein Q7542_13785, partial [Glaesserella parasuis]|nr:hypothetical protein [Glaesserella parasuis]
PLYFGENRAKTLVKVLVGLVRLFLLEKTFITPTNKSIFIYFPLYYFPSPVHGGGLGRGDCP